MLLDRDVDASVEVEVDAELELDATCISASASGPAPGIMAIPDVTVFDAFEDGDDGCECEGGYTSASVSTPVIVLVFVLPFAADERVGEGMPVTFKRAERCYREPGVGCRYLSASVLGITIRSCTYSRQRYRRRRELPLVNMADGDGGWLKH